MVLRTIAWGTALGMLMLVGCSSRSASDDPGQRSRGVEAKTTAEPEATCPSVVRVRVLYPGASAEDVEHLVVMPVEDALSGVSGLQRLTSQSREGEARLRLELAEGTDAARVRTHLTEHLADALPADAEQPTVFETAPPVALTPIEVRGEPSAIPAVLALLRGAGVNADAVGRRIPILRVRISDTRLAAHGFTRDQIRGAITAMPSTSDAMTALVDLELGAAGDTRVRLGDLATIELSQTPTPVVLDASGELGLIAAAGPAPADVSSQLPPEVQLKARAPIRAPQCHRTPLQGLATVVALRVKSADAPGEAQRLLAELARLDADVLGLVGVTDGFGLDLASSDAALHLLFPAAAPQAVLERLRAYPQVEPVRVWGPPITRVVVAGPHAERHASALRALRGALEAQGFFALAPEPAAAPQLSLSLRPTATALGLTATDIARQVRSAVTDEPFTIVSVGNERVPVVLQNDSSDADVDTLRSLKLRTPAGDRVPLSAVATFEEKLVAADRWRVDRQPARKLQTNAPGPAVLATWETLASDYPDVALTAD